MAASIVINTLAKHEPPTPQQFAAAADMVARFAQSWNAPDAESLRELMHEDTQNLIPPMTAPADREGVVQYFRQVLERFPDMRLDIIRWAPTGDMVLIEWLATATVAGSPLSWTGIDRFRIRGDRMDQGQVYWDTRGVAERVAQLTQGQQAAALS